MENFVFVNESLKLHVLAYINPYKLPNILFNRHLRRNVNYLTNIFNNEAFLKHIISNHIKCVLKKNTIVQFQITRFNVIVKKLIDKYINGELIISDKSIKKFIGKCSLFDTVLKILTLNKTDILNQPIYTYIGKPELYVAMYSTVNDKITQSLYKLLLDYSDAHIRFDNDVLYVNKSTISVFISNDELILSKKFWKNEKIHRTNIYTDIIYALINMICDEHNLAYGTTFHGSYIQTICEDLICNDINMLHDIVFGY
jgi:hypothetical protein